MKWIRKFLPVSRSLCTTPNDIFERKVNSKPRTTRDWLVYNKAEIIQFYIWQVYPGVVIQEGLVIMSSQKNDIAENDVNDYFIVHFALDLF